MLGVFNICTYISSFWKIVNLLAELKGDKVFKTRNIKDR